MKTMISSLKYVGLSVFTIGILSLTLMSSTILAAPNSLDDGGTGDGCSRTFLGFPAWYNGLAEKNGDSCDIKSPSDFGENGLSKFIWTIVFNVVEMILRAAGYASVAFIIYGGYRYITSAGSADGMAGAKKTIMNAVIGLILSIAAVAIVATISRGLGV